MDIEEARTILEAEAKTRRNLREAKARSFLHHRRNGLSATDAWQHVALETTDEQREWDAAYTERLLLSYFHGLVAPEQGDD